MTSEAPALAAGLTITDIPNSRGLALATERNQSFSRQLPGLQLAVDSTSLGEFKICPRRYYYSIILGLQPSLESVHLTFGLLWHGALERYDHARSAGASHTEAEQSAILWALQETWIDGKPWQSLDPNKNRFTLVRSLVWYLEQFGENDPCETVQLSNGRPAVELSFTFAAGAEASTGEQFMFCGHMDRVVELGGILFVLDRKTTKHTLGPRLVAEYSPHNQFSLYALAGKIAFSVPVQGIILDLAQIGVGFTRFERAPIPRTEEQLNEWLTDAWWWLRSMDDCAQRQHWPMNDKSCGMYGGCQFRGVCGRPRAARAFAGEFRHRQWDPLVRRGDI